jgi:hypothetical protein
VKSVARTAAVVVPLALSLSPLAACSKDSSAVARGGECYLATDCAPGLVCVPQKDGRRLCSDDLTGLGNPPPEGGAGDAGEAGDAPNNPDAPVNPPDTGTQDTGTDTGTPPQDAADDG